MAGIAATVLHRVAMSLQYCNNHRQPKTRDVQNRFLFQFGFGSVFEKNLDSVQLGIKNVVRFRYYSYLLLT